MLRSAVRMPTCFAALCYTACPLAWSKCRRRPHWWWPCAVFSRPCRSIALLRKTHRSYAVMLLFSVAFSNISLLLVQMLLNAPRAEVRQYVLDEMNIIQKLRYPQTVADREEAQKRRRRRTQPPPAAPAPAPQFDRVEDLNAARRHCYDAKVAIFGARCVLESKISPYHMHF